MANGGAPGARPAGPGASSLFALIQWEASSKGRKVVRVSSDGRSGLFYFCNGRIVHASAGKLLGEAAVREMLGWNQGTFARFDHFDGAWPMFETVTASTDSVLLRAARFLDQDDEPAIVVVTEIPEALEEPEPTIILDGSLKGEEELTMRLSAAGELIERRGDGDGEGFSEVVAYTARITDLVGEILGLEHFASVELTFRDSKCVLARQPDHTLLAIRGDARGSIEGLRLKVGLRAG
jgi:hypothetical protein